MSKEMVYFNASKQIETITIHYNSKIDGTFVEEVVNHIKEISKKMSKIDLKNPKDYYAIQVFVYPSLKLFNKIFGGELEKRFYSRKRSLEDLYIVKDSEGNIHIALPRGKSQEKYEAIKKVLVMKILGEYMDDRQKSMADKLLKASLKSKEYEKRELEDNLDKESDKEMEESQEDIDEKLDDVEEINEEEIVEDDELTEEELNDIILVQQELDIIEPSEDEIYEEDQQENDTDTLPIKPNQTQQWLDIGWSAFISGKLKNEEHIKKFSEHISKNGVKKLGQLSKNKLLGNYNYSEEYACAIVEYIVNTYGYKKFVQYYNDPKDIEGVFGISKFVFNSNVKAYIYSKYKLNEMIIEADQKVITEVTQINFDQTEGIGIMEFNEEKSVAHDDKSIKI